MAETIMKRNAKNNHDVRFLRRVLTSPWSLNCQRAAWSLHRYGFSTCFSRDTARTLLAASQSSSHRSNCQLSSQLASLSTCRMCRVARRTHATRPAPRTLTRKLVAPRPALTFQTFVLCLKPFKKHLCDCTYSIMQWKYSGLFWPVMFITFSRHINSYKIYWQRVARLS